MYCCKSNKCINSCSYFVSSPQSRTQLQRLAEGSPASRRAGGSSSQFGLARAGARPVLQLGRQGVQQPHGISEADIVVIEQEDGDTHFNEVLANQRKMAKLQLVILERLDRQSDLIKALTKRLATQTTHGNIHIAQTTHGGIHKSYQHEINTHVR